jgi:hypothetical protein
MIRRLVLHRLWIPAVVLMTTGAFIPEAREATTRMSRVSRAAGTYGSEHTDANELGGTRFRWMKWRSALHEPVRGQVLMVPIYVGRPGIADEVLRLRVRAEGHQLPTLELRKVGWVTVTCDLARVFGEDRWQSMRAVTLAFTLTPVSPGALSDWGFPGIGLGDVGWSGAPK